MDISPDLTFVLAASAIAAVGLFIRHYSNDAVAKRGLRRARRHPIHAFPRGRTGRIVGTVRAAAETLEAPVSGRRCVAYVARVHEKAGRGAADRAYGLIIEEIKACPFLVEDTTGRAIVMPKGASFVLKVDAREQSGSLLARASLDELLHRHGQGSDGALFNRNLRFEEGLLEEGDRVAVYGKGRIEPDPDPNPIGAGAGNYRDRAMRLVLEETRNGRLFVSDDPATFSG